MNPKTVIAALNRGERKMKAVFYSTPAMLLTLMSLAGCSKNSPTAPDNSYNPKIVPAEFVSGVTNPFFPLAPGVGFVMDIHTKGEAKKLELINITIR